MADLPTSVVTCDLEGRIETVNEGAERLFGWTAEELVGRRRVSIFSPGMVVLAHVPRWLAEARKKGEFRGRTVFVRKDGTRFAAEIRITPTKRGGRQVGYCGVTRPLPDVDPAEVEPPIPLGARIFRWLVVTRAPFLTATLVPVLVGAAWAAGRVDPFPWGHFALALIGALALHVAANTSNDYFDWRSGTDEANNDYFMPFSGGSRSLELGLVSERGLLAIAVVATLVGAACGLALVAAGRPWLLAIGAFGALTAWAYTAPPLRLAARKGLGELAVALDFGPLMTAGTAYAITGELTPGDFLVGVPVGLLVAAILWVNEMPDAPSDLATGKTNLVAVLGRRAARWGYPPLVLGAFAAIALGVALGGLDAWTLVALLPLPLAVRAVRTVIEHHSDRGLVTACRDTIQVHLATGLLLAVGLLL